MYMASVSGPLSMSVIHHNHCGRGGGALTGDQAPLPGKWNTISGCSTFVKRIIKQCYQRAKTRKSTWDYSRESPILSVRISYGKSLIHFIWQWSDLCANPMLSAAVMRRCGCSLSYRAYLWFSSSQDRFLWCLNWYTLCCKAHCLGVSVSGLISFKIASFDVSTCTLSCKVKCLSASVSGLMSQLVPSPAKRVAISYFCFHW
jgi:hypothetical protein